MLCKISLENHFFKLCVNKIPLVRQHIHFCDDDIPSAAEQKYSVVINMIICAVASFFPGINAGHVKLRFLVRFQLETLREDIVQSLSVLGRLKGVGGCDVWFLERWGFSHSRIYSCFPGYQCEKLAPFSGEGPTQTFLAHLIH